MKKFLAAMVCVILSAVALALCVIYHEALMEANIAGYCLLVIGSLMTLVASFSIATEDLY